MVVYYLFSGYLCNGNVNNFGVFLSVDEWCDEFC